MITEELKQEFGLFPTIEEMYNFIKSNPKDQKGKNSIQWVAHYMETLYHYASQCDHVTEIGINQVNSTWAFLHAKPKNGVVSIDIDLNGRPWQSVDKDRVGYYTNIWLDWARELASQQSIAFTAVEISSLDYDIANNATDLLFIDGLHTYEQVSQELALYGPHVNKYIIMHDTTLYPTLSLAAEFFARDSKQWTIEQKLTSNPGLTILKRNV